MSSNSHSVKAVLDVELASKQSEELRRILEHQDGRIYTIIDNENGRTIDGQSVPSGSSVEVDITNIVLLKNDYPSLTFNETPFYSIEEVD